MQVTPKELNAIAAKLAEQVRSNRRKAADVIPPGWFTNKQLRKAIGKSVAWTNRKLVWAGAERKMFHTQCGKFLRKVPHYHLK